MSKLLEVKNLRVSYHTYAGEVQSVRGVSFDLDEGEAIAVVGESGCGKSVTAKTIMGLIKDPGEIKEGSEIIYRGQDILKLSKKGNEPISWKGSGYYFSGRTCGSESDHARGKADYGKYSAA